MRQRDSDTGFIPCSVQGISEDAGDRASRVLRGSDESEEGVASARTIHRIEAVLRDMTPDSILMEAAELVKGVRAKQHGDYTKLQSRIADLWSTYLGTSISASQVAFCMTLVKVARDEVGDFNEDDGKDAAAYTALWAALSYQEHTS